MIKTGTGNTTQWKPFMVVFLPIDPGRGGGSFEQGICRALKKGYKIFGQIEYVTIEKKLYGLTSIMKDES